MPRSRITKLFLLFSLVLILWAAASAFAAVNYAAKPGFNVVGVTPLLVSQHTSAFPLLSAWKTLYGVSAVESYDQTNGVMLRAEIDESNIRTGIDFPLSENSALYVYATGSGTIDLGSIAECSSQGFKTGLNLASFFCLPTGFTSYALFNSLGASNVPSISRYDNVSGRWLTTAADSGSAIGDNFVITPGEGYVIYVASDIPNWITPNQQFTVSPAALTVHQEQSGVALTLSIPNLASAGGVTANLFSTNTAVLTVPSLVTIPAGSSSVSVPVTVLNSGNAATATAEVHATRPNWLDGKSVLTVLPKPTVNLTPTTTMTGQGWTYFLTATLTEAAPASGVTVTLTPFPSGIVSCPATITIPEGAITSQATVTAIGVGTATIAASAPGFLSGSVNAITINPVQTIGIGPTFSQTVGVMVSTSTTSTTATTYTPLISQAVGVTVGAVITGLSPNHGAIGTSDMTLRINGYGLASATTVTIIPATGVTVQNGTLVAAGDGSYVEVHIAIDVNAPISQRTVVLATAGGGIVPASPGANLFSVSYQPPQLWSLLPNFGLTGSTMTLQVNGSNLQQATAISFIPSDGISISNPPTVSTDGSLATVNISIAANAVTGFRAVTITTPGGVTPADVSAANTFDVRSAVPPSGNTYASYAPIVSAQLGVSVQTSATTTTSTAYTPVVSLPVGVTVGPVITSVAPPSGAIGSAGLLVQVNGAGLVSAASMTFVPSTGITIEPLTFAAADSSVHAIIDIDPNAPLVARTIVLGGVAAQPASPGANQFRVTLPVPELLAIQPIRQQAGSTFTLTVMGVNLTSASAINFTPGAGISISNPPTVSSDGTTATVTVVIAANAPTGATIVTVTTPGGVTSSTASAANTFTITSDAGTTYSSLTSPAVGVLVSLSTSTTSQSVTYGSLISLPIGVSVTTAPTPTSQNVGYGPVVSLPIGVVVGPTVTNMTQNTIEPGTTATITIYGAGLDQVNAVQIQPPAGFTVGTPVPSGNGLMTTVTITADAGVSVGAKAIIVSSATGAINPASPGALLLLAGPKPIINTMQVGAGSPLAIAGTTVTLTINGTHLQGATQVQFIPSDGIQVSNPPTYYTDGNGEHASVTVIISSLATYGDHVVVISTPYGSTDSTRAAGNANIFTVASPTGWNVPVPGDDKPVLASRGADRPAPLQESDSRLDPSKAMLFVALMRPRDERREAAAAEAAYSVHQLSWQADYDLRDVTGNARNRYYLSSGYRAPPGA